MQDPKSNEERFATTIVLPRDELAVRRARKMTKPPAVSIEQLQRVHRLLAAAELRQRAEQDE
ncbi:MAG TPA: hypothetical protein VFX89_19790 [Gammaproteobacteria bacterium]|nr:hypothetical protein [Gammaproteobacteria bacterium]